MDPGAPLRWSPREVRPRRNMRENSLQHLACVETPRPPAARCGSIQFGRSVHGAKRPRKILRLLLESGSPVNG